MKREFLVSLGLATASAAQAASPLLCSEYASGLATMTSVDRAMRSRWDMKALYESPRAKLPKIIELTNLVDRRNTERFKRLVAACGWPDSKRHGQSAVDDSWLIAQHADHDRRFQRDFLKEVQRKMATGEGSAVQLAYLSDRLDVADKKPQKYGTQLVQKAPCEFEFSPLDARDKVEARRKELGWPSLEDYKNLVHENALPPECKPSMAGTP